MDKNVRVNLRSIIDGMTETHEDQRQQNTQSDISM